MTTFLIGGGWTASARPLVYGPLLEAAGANPVVACVVVDEGDGAAELDRWATALLATAACVPVPVLVPEGGRLSVSELGDATAVLVCGGLTPAYAAALAPAATELRAWLGGGRHYAGFSAGAAVAAGDAVVGGWQIDGVPVCPDDAGEDLGEVSVVPGLGLVPFAIDVHAAQWGTLNRLIAAVGAGRVGTGLAIDEDTLVVVDGGMARVAGFGRVHRITGAGDAVAVRSFGAGELIAVGEGAGARG